MSSNIIRCLQASIIIELKTTESINRFRIFALCRSAIGKEREEHYISRRFSLSLSSTVTVRVIAGIGPIDGLSNHHALIPGLIRKPSVGGVYESRRCLYQLSGILVMANR